ncbi:MAG TPA: amidophosphoribosyltransferase [Candidatus Saccharimonadales bacterium]|nr:amidophosphoribosyltransferase [Candidatus Saccharimonadales bacterium]
MREGQPWAKDPDEDLLQEACGVVGVMAAAQELPVAQLTYSALAGLQHRGEGAAGIVIGEENFGGFRFVGIKDTGMVADVFSDRAATIDKMASSAILGVGHVRWPTSAQAGDPFHAAQPFLKGELVVAQNGHIEEMGRIAEQYGIKNYVSDGDALTQTLEFLSRPEHAGSTLDAMHDLFPRLDGGYSLVIAEPNRIHGIRDPWGTRPLWLGRFATGAFMIASEQPVLHEAGKVTDEREIAPGEIVSIDRHGNTESSLINREAKGGLCALEGVYFARPDGILDGRSVYQSRMEMGRLLAREHPADADVVIGVPDSGTIAAMGYAEESAIPYAIGLFRNPYTTRTFIQSSPEVRRRMVLEKLRPNRQVIEGRRLVVVDDSIVRGTSSDALTEVLRSAGATEVHYRISSAPFVNPCYSGTAISNPHTLFARKYPTHQERVAKLGADSLGYLSTEGVAQAQGKRIGSLCMACMDGSYPFEVPLPVSERRILPVQPTNR